MTKFLLLGGAVCISFCASITVPAHAEPVFKSRAGSAQTAQGGRIGRSAAAARGNYGAAAGRRGIVGDGQGNVLGGADSAFTTESGAQGSRRARLNRSSDGSITASARSDANGPNGSAQRNADFTRNADGSASGERNTTLTNSDTGTTFDASTAYTKGSGVSRSASCTDASGNSVACLDR